MDTFNHAKPASSIFQRIAAVENYKIQTLALICAITLYAFFGLPTPDSPGMIESTIGALIIIAIGPINALQALRINSSAPLWRSAGQALLLYGLPVGLIAGLLQGNSLNAMLRDIIPFLFLLLPVFLFTQFKSNRMPFTPILIAALGLGIIFALRAISENFSALGAALFLNPQDSELTYLANAPTILFTTLFLGGYAARKFISGPTLKTFGLFGLLITFSLLCILPMALTVQRASLGYVGLFALLLIIAGLWKYPYRTLPALTFAALILIPAYGILASAFDMLWHKTTLVGFNMRFEELRTVWTEISTSPLTLLFGKGWGSGFSSPAVAGLEVNFTHSLLTSAALKTGLIGVLLSASYLWGMFTLLRKHLQNNIVLVLALSGPFLIDSFLYASFKSLDFGLILLLICMIDSTHHFSTPNNSQNIAKQP